MALSERLAWTLDWQSRHLTPLLRQGATETRLRDFWRDERHMDEVLARVLPTGPTRWLDVGGGQTTPLRWVDGDAVVVDPLASHYATGGALPNDGVRYLIGEGEDLPLESNGFDVVVCTNCIDHTARPNAVMQEIRRVLREGGWLWLTCEVHPIDHPRNAGHPHAMSAQDIRALVDPFDIVETWESPWRGVYRYCLSPLI